ncbi:glycosyl hydrolase family 18 protein [Spiroplasma endosymbiont of Dioctria linearis]|uniref:glycosyl hydrolase family 18 protein n=1 Tax=Spiroplasma endosymbiont of Dioctria linearis TaxID=3066290 RepID=UPI00313E9798
MKKILGLLSSLSLVAIGTTSVVACGYSIGDINDENHLVNHVLRTSLGMLENDNKETIKAKIQELNPGLDANSYKVAKVNKNKTALIAATKKGAYTGAMEVKFNLLGEPIKLEEKVLVGYYNDGKDWVVEGERIPTFEELVETNYNVISIGDFYASKALEMPTFNPKKPEEIKNGIELLHQNDKKAIISMGGALSTKMKFTTDKKEELKAAILNVIDEYKFDGIDINWEIQSTTDRESQQVMTDVLKEIKGERENFIISLSTTPDGLRLATEIGGAPSYIPFFKGLDGYYNWVTPKAYNQFGYDVIIEDAEKRILNWDDKDDTCQVEQSGELKCSITNDNLEHRAEFYYLLTKYATAKYSKKNDYFIIDPDKFVLGVSTHEYVAEGKGAASEDALKKSYELLAKDGIYTKGLMAWTINSDAYDGKIASIPQEGKDPLIIKWDKWTFSKWYKDIYLQEKK